MYVCVFEKKRTKCKTGFKLQKFKKENRIYSGTKVAKIKGFFGQSKNDNL